MDADRDSEHQVLVDLLRSAWIVEAARARVYEVWARADGRFAASAVRAAAAAGIVARSLESRDLRPDHALVEPHAGWILELLSEDPAATPLADLFIARLGNWVDAHAGSFLDDGADEIRALSAEESAGLAFPSQMPPTPPFEPVATPHIEPQGDTLFRFAILADTHFGSPHAEEMVGAAISDINASGAELCIQLGDITDHGNRDEFRLAKKALDGIEMPLHMMMGNHDVYSYAERAMTGRSYFAETFGREPDGELIEHRGFRFAVLDSAEHILSPFTPFNMVTGKFMEGSGGAIVRGALSVPQHEILAQLAEPGSPPAFVFLHHPPQPFTSFPPVIFGLRDLDSGRLNAVVDSGNIWGVFVGHTHRNARPRTYDGVVVQEVAIPRDYPFGYALVDVSRTGYTYRFCQISDEELVRSTQGQLFHIQTRYSLGTETERAFTWTSRSG